MATPRVTIDQLPEQAAAEDTNYVIVQDEGITKKMSMATLKNVTSTPLAAHINATVDAHDATAISAVASGVGVDSATVQGQLSQLATLADAAVTQAEGDARYVNLTGDTMTGPLVLPGAPTVDLHAATKKYVDDSVATSTGGITQAEADGWYVNVTGDTVTGPLSVEGGLAAGNMPITSVGSGIAATDAATVAQVTDRVLKAGDAMTGALTVGNAASVDQLKLRHASPTLALENAAGSTRYATLLSDTTQTRLQAAVGDAHVQSLNGAALLSGKTDMKLSLEDVAGRAINGWAGFRNPIILPMGTAAGDVEGLLTGKGYQFEIGVVAGSKLRVMSGGFEKASIDKDGFITAVARRYRASRASVSVANGDGQHTGALTVVENVGGFTGSGATGTPLIVPVDGSYAVTLSFVATAPAGGFVAAAPANLSAAVIAIGGNSYMVTLQPNTGNRVGGTITAFAAAGSGITLTIRNGTGAAVTCTQMMEVVKVA